ncbi:MAG TPA: peptidoglycan DD-metalloendopeptidase family protein [Pyrinomonadaceae bacterium]|nr:peptidoglycan DD-metalloendopeptidase family protein [Pyrinomonadaceae bacterium]
MPEFAISNSVGRRTKGAVNQFADVETVQNMLRLAAMIEFRPQFDPGGIDGTIDANEAGDDTVKAIEAFQSQFFNTPDGVIEVGKRTWRELVDVLDGDDDNQPVPVNGPVVPVSDSECLFPFKSLPEVNWTEGMRRFGATRSNGARAHAGCDLYFPTGTVIHAVTSGTVIADPYWFYDGTYALEIDHGGFVARYGEIQKHALVRKGDHVSPGQPIAKVGNLLSIVQSMLHLELYDKSAQGALTVKTSKTAKTSGGIPFWRRKDLMDPTPKLNVWKNNLPL